MRLTRSASDRILGGVCAGVARHFGWDVSMTRVVTAVSMIFFGSGALVYIALWILMPVDDL